MLGTDSLVNLVLKMVDVISQFLNFESSIISSYFFENATVSLVFLIRQFVYKNILSVPPPILLMVSLPHRRSPMSPMSSSSINAALYFFFFTLPWCVLSIALLARDINLLLIRPETIFLELMLCTVWPKNPFSRSL